MTSETIEKVQKSTSMLWKKDLRNLSSHRYFYRLLSATSSIFHPNMQHPKFYTFSISSSRFHLYLLILSISFLRFHPYFFILDILTFLYNPLSFQALKIHPEQFHNGILRLAISFLLFHPYDSISSNLSLLFHTIDFHLLYFILTCFILDFSS